MFLVGTKTILNGNFECEIKIMFRNFIQVKNYIMPEFITNILSLAGLAIYDTMQVKTYVKVYCIYYNNRKIDILRLNKSSFIA